MSYYNTTSLSGEDLRVAQNSALKQEDRIEQFFRVNGTIEMTPFEVMDTLYGQALVPITSVRRAMTNLTTKGVLIKTDTQRVGPYGKVSNCWKLNR